MLKPNLQTDLQWLNRISFKLQMFKPKRANHSYNCRCPICGDSKKSKYKARFWFLVKSGSLLTYCHNCGYSHSFYKFMKDFAPAEFEAYKRETLFDKFSHQRPISTPKPVTKTVSSVSRFKDRLEHVVPIIDLKKDHPAYVYLKNRGFDRSQMRRLLYSDNFKLTAMSLNKESSSKLVEEPRIVIPFWTSDKQIKLLQGRSMLGNDKMKYITIKAHEDVDKIYGLEELDETMTSYGVEGPLDSLFVTNSLAKCDGDLERLDVDVLIYDNQPRNREVVAFMEKAIANGRSVVIWPASPNNKQDINDLILKGVTQQQLMKVLEQRTFSGLKAKLEFERWRRV